ncbi:MAG: gliding motility protein GldN [Crocinitomicaceae bacterium]|nr:gliding motility protein GldN [Crocinitomicaceae bacterium]
MKRIWSIVFSVVFMFALPAFGQGGVNNGEMLGPVPNPSPGVLDGVYVPEHIPTKKLIPWEHVREADAVWSKRVWRYIDLREKINHPMYYPLDKINAEISPTDLEWTKHQRRWSLWTVILTNVLNGNLTVYSPENPLNKIKDGDSFKYPIAPPPGKTVSDSVWFIDNLLGYLATEEACERIPIPSQVDPEEDSMRQIVVNGEIIWDIVMTTCPYIYFQSEDIVQYRLKEDWFFDKERSVMDVRIIGIAPVRYATNEDKTAITGYEEIFWLYFPECRYVFQNYYVYNAQNDSRWFSYDDLFWKREFNSVIYRSSNVYDRKIDTYRVGVDALLESEKITNEIRMIEHDVWSL